MKSAMKCFFFFTILAKKLRYYTIYFGFLRLLLLCSCYVQHHCSVNQLIKPEFVSLCTQVALISSCL